MGKKNELVLVLDRSGSMSSVKDDAIGGFNTLLKEQQKENPDLRMTVVQFNTAVNTLYNREKISEVEPLDKYSYVPSGMTALLDAVGETVVKVSKRRGKKKGQVIFAIITDGQENSSHEYQKDTVKKLIEKHKEKHGWKFMFLGANIDAFAEAGGLGIPQAYTSVYAGDAWGTGSAYVALSHTVSRAFADPDADINLAETYATVDGRDTGTN